MKKKKFMNGENLVISISSKKKLDEKFCFSFLRELPKKAGLSPYANPQIHFFPNEQALSEKGISGTMMMIESHCAFHHWSEINFTNVTISSCKKILEDDVIEWLVETFGAESFSWEKILWPVL